MWKFIRFLNENYWQIYINGSRYVLKKNKRWVINVYKVFGGDEGSRTLVRESVTKGIYKLIKF